MRDSVSEMAVLLAFFALAAPPPPNTPIPRDPGALATTLSSTTHDLRAAVDHWRASGARAVPEDVTLYALYQQRILILLSEKHRLAKAVFARLYAPALQSEVLARRGLGRLSRPRPLSAFRTGPAEPADRLRGYYLEAQRRFGVTWNVLAAVNYVESAFNKLRNASSAGAQGPMQFIPSTWRAYGLGGNVHGHTTRSSAPPGTSTRTARRAATAGRSTVTTRPGSTSPRCSATQPDHADPRAYASSRPPGVRGPPRPRQANRAAVTDYGYLVICSACGTGTGRAGVLLQLPRRSRSPASAMGPPTTRRPRCGGAAVRSTPSRSQPAGGGPSGAWSPSSSATWSAAPLSGTGPRRSGPPSLATSTPRVG
jgi:hypothetical protein